MVVMKGRTCEKEVKNKSTYTSRRRGKRVKADA